MNNNQINFTKRAIAGLPIPKQGIDTYHDTKIRGLKIRIRASGLKTFLLYRKIGRRPERVTLGRFPDMTVEQARRHADLQNAKIADGINPNQLKRDQRDSLSFSTLFEEYMDKQAKVHNKAWKLTQGIYDNHLTKLKNREVNLITKDDVRSLHVKVGKNSGHYIANRVLQLISVVYNFTDVSPNPAKGIKKFKETQRDRFLHPDEMPKFFASLDQEENETARDYIIMSLLTGARRSNVLQMRWDEVHLTRGTWRIPDTKNGESQTVPLVTEAIELLKIRKNSTGGEWVFPGGGKLGHLVEPRKAWNRVLKRAGIKDLRLHDLRRTLGSWQASCGSSLTVIGKSLGHKNLATTSIYARLNLDPVRDSMNAATSSIFSAARKENEQQL